MKILFYVFISVHYMFRATSCSSSGELIVSVQHLVCHSVPVTVLCAGRKGTTRFIDTNDSPDDEHEVVRNI